MPPASRSVSSPRVLVPAVTVVGVLVLISVLGTVIYVIRVYRKRQRRGPTEKAQALEVRNSWVEGRPTTADQLVDVHTAEIALGVAPPPVIHRNSGMSKIERITGTALSISLYNEPMDDSRRSSMESVTRESYQPSFTVRTATVTLPDFPLSPTTSELSDISDASSRTQQLAPPPPASLARYAGLAALSRANTVTPRKPPHIATQYTPPRSQRRRSSSVQFPRRKSYDPSPARRKSSLASECTFETSAFGRSDSSVSTLTFGADGRTVSSLHTLPPPPAAARNTHRRSWSGRSILLLDTLTEPPQLPTPAPPEPPQFPPYLSRTYSTTSIMSDPSSVSSLSLGGLSPRPQTIDTETELEEEMARIRERALRNSDERRHRRRVMEEREMGRGSGDREDGLRPAREGFRFV